ncbi:hypothetical protein GCM10017562_16750 [Streptomyces roseofulvus]
MRRTRWTVLSESGHKGAAEVRIPGGERGQATPRRARWVTKVTRWKCEEWPEPIARETGGGGRENLTEGGLGEYPR